MRAGAFLLLSAFNASASAQDVRLTPGAAVALEAVTGSSHAFAVEVGADEFVHLEIFQMGADAAITVLDPTGAPLAEIDDADAEQPLETASWTRSVPGSYRVIVRVKAAVRSARLEVRLDPLRPSEPRDALWLQWERDSKLSDPPADETERAAWPVGWNAPWKGGGAWARREAPCACSSRSSPI